MNEELRQSILGSKEMASYYQEIEIKQILDELKIRSQHSVYYQDPIEQKMRELDVLFSMDFERNGSNEFLKKISVFGVVECKSMKGNQIIFNSDNALSPYDITSWPLLSIIDRRNSILQRLGRAFNAHKTMSGLMNHAYTDKEIQQTINDELNLLSPRDFQITKANYFREMAGPDAKDLDNSVLWKAQRGLESAIIHFKKDDSDFAETTIVADMHQQNIRPEEMWSHIKAEFREIIIYIPIIVTSALLLTIKDQDLEPQPFVRFCRTKRFNSADFYFDVVSTESFKAYVANLNSFLTKNYEALGYKRFR